MLRPDLIEPMSKPPHFTATGSKEHGRNSLDCGKKSAYLGTSRLLSYVVGVVRRLYCCCSHRRYGYQQPENHGQVGQHSGDECSGLAHHGGDVRSDNRTIGHFAEVTPKVVAT
jgi:hypothetical protein